MPHYLIESLLCFHHRQTEAHPQPSICRAQSATVPQLYIKKQSKMAHHRHSQIQRGFDMEEQPARGQYTAYRSSMSIGIMTTCLLMFR